MFSFLHLLGVVSSFLICCAADQIVLDSTRASNESLLWGPYRPNLYFGVRPRLPKSLMTGLLWAKVDDYTSVQQNFRHTCEQGPGMAGYGWDEYDARTGGKQTIHDADNKIDVTTEFVKFPGGHHGGGWGVRVKGTPREDAPPRLMTTVMFYGYMDGLGRLGVQNTPDDHGIQGTVVMEGETDQLGKFKIDITEGPATNKHPPPTHESYKDKPLDRTIVSSFQVPEETLWQTTALIFTHMKTEVEAYMQVYGQEHPPPPWQVFTIGNEIKQGNLHLTQKVFEGAFEFDILYSPESGPAVTSDEMTKGIQDSLKSFRTRFAKVLAPKAPFTDPKYDVFAKSMFSNLAGGIGYFFGEHVVDRASHPSYDEENEGFAEEAAEARRTSDKLRLEGPYELFTSIPSRPFFPRGFLWDEGFHLLPIADWDLDLTLEIVRSWFRLMDDDGWIAREQILGPEARSKVPPEFQVQYPHYANPPTLFLVLEGLIDKINAKGGTDANNSEDRFDAIRNVHVRDSQRGIDYLKLIYPLLKRQYFWFRKTQAGEVKAYDRDAFSTKEAYRWRGRTVDHVLTSGLDDYPRPQPPHPGELHVDLLSWVGMMTRSLQRIATAIGETDDVKEFSGYQTAILRNIEDLHWDKAQEAYCDATIDDYEESVHVCHKGYVSIFPFMVGLLPPDSPRLGPILKTIGDPDELWSDYGIRSLSRKDEFYATGENYWRSPIWMNMNFMIVKQLHNLALVKGPYKNEARVLYNKLRRNLVHNVYDQWARTGFAWEQYNPETGAGQRTQHFTGWTSLIVKIMHMDELARPGGGQHDEL